MLPGKARAHTWELAMESSVAFVHRLSLQRKSKPSKVKPFFVAEKKEPGTLSDVEGLHWKLRESRLVDRGRTRMTSFVTRSFVQDLLVARIYFSWRWRKALRNPDLLERRVFLGLLGPAQDPTVVRWWWVRE